MTTPWILLPALACPLVTAAILTLMLRPTRRNDSTADSAARLREVGAFRALLAAGADGSDIGPIIGTNR